MTVRENSGLPAMICFQICPGEQSRRKRFAPGGQNGYVGIMTKPGSAIGITIANNII